MSVRRSIREPNCRNGISGEWRVSAVEIRPKLIVLYFGKIALWGATGRMSELVRSGNAHNEPMMSAFHPIATEQRTRIYVGSAPGSDMRLLFSTARSRCPRYCYGRRRARSVCWWAASEFRPSRAEHEVVATTFTAVTHPVGAAPYQRQAQTAERRLGQRILPGCAPARRSGRTGCRRPLP